MRTVRCNGRRIPACTGHGGVYPSMHWAGKGCLHRGVCPIGLSALEVSACGAGGVSALGVSAQGAMSATHPHEHNDRRL